MALKLDIFANARQLISEMKRSSASVEDISDALDDMARDGDDAADKLEGSFKDMARDAKRAGDDIADGVGGGLKDLKGEAGQSGREAAASFSGEWGDVGDFLQETVANGLGGFGPIGAAAGIAAAAGLGVVTSVITAQQEAADELKARISSAYQTAAEEGRTYLDTAQIIAEASDLMFNKDRAEEWKRVQEDANLLGLDLYDVIAANAGELSKQEEVQKRIAALLEETDGAASDYAGKLILASERWGRVNEDTETAKRKSQELAEIQKRAEQERRDQIERTARVAGERYEGLAQKYGQKITIPIDADTSRFDQAVARARREGAKGIDVIVRPGVRQVG